MHSVSTQSRHSTPKGKTNPLRPKSSKNSFAPPKDRPSTDYDSAPQAVLPPSPKKSYFDKYPSRAERIKSYEKPRPDTAPSGAVGAPMEFKRPCTPSPRKPPGKAREPDAPKATYIFPTKDSPPHSTRTRSRTNSFHDVASTRSDSTAAFTSAHGSLYTTAHSPLTTETFTPPRTPTPQSTYDGVVVAQTSGVETMDALVDQMNGDVDGGDYLAALQWRGHGSKSKKKPSSVPHHPLYHPPLPTPPEGVKLGGRLSSSDMRAGFAKSSRSSRPSTSTSASRTRVTSEASPTKPAKTYTTQQPEKPIIMTTSPTVESMDSAIRDYLATIEAPLSRKKHIVPSISEIIRTHAPEHAKYRSARSSTEAGSMHRPELQKQSTAPDGKEDDGDSSSVDSVLEEITQMVSKSPPRHLHHAKSFPNRPHEEWGPHSRARSEADTEPPMPTYSPYSARGPHSEGSYAASIFSTSTTPSLGVPSLHQFPPGSKTPTLEMAQYLRSPRLTRLINLRRHPHAGITVSLADVGSSTGHPVVIYLGLGCVRYLIALYDELAEALGLRLICVDRWGLGRTSDAPPEKRGLLEWAAVMEEVADIMHLEKFSVIAHSAGAPYALASTLRMGDRIVGSAHLLAPWVSMSVDGGYKWLKYVPAGLIKTAQAAEWKVQGWMLGKPPTITYQGIGYDVRAPISNEPASPPKTRGLRSPTRESFSTSEYDDLADFDGRFCSAVSLPKVDDATEPKAKVNREHSEECQSKKKSSRSLMGLFESKPKPSRPKPSRTASAPGVEAPSSASSVKAPGLKGLRSISSLRHSKTSSSSQAKNIANKSKSDVALPPRESLHEFGANHSIEVERDVAAAAEDPSLGSTTPTALNFPTSRPTSSSSNSHSTPPSDVIGPHRTRRTYSVTSRSTYYPPLSPYALSEDHQPFLQPPSPNPSTGSTPSSTGTAKGGQKGGITLAGALLRASHAESLKGGTADLLAILERGDAKPWGFSYTDVQHPVKVWYGDRDDKIGIGSVRWMERVMKDCQLTIVKGGDHGLMTNSHVVVEVLESIAKEWRNRGW